MSSQIATGSARRRPQPGQPAALPLAAPSQLPLPPSYKRDLDRALEILRGFGCTEVYLFGSLARGKIRPNSDIDLAVRGCPKGEFFRLYATLMMSLEHSVDLVSMEYQDRFAKLLEKRGSLVQLA